MTNTDRHFHASAIILLAFASALTGVAQSNVDAQQAASPVSLMAADAHPSFEVATIKATNPGTPGQGFHSEGRSIFIENESVNDILGYAYGIQQRQIVNGPAWLSSDRYDIKGIPDVAGEPNFRQRQEMVQRLLADRFGLKFHHEQRQLPVYAVTIAKGGPKLAKSVGDPNAPANDSGYGRNYQQVKSFTNYSMADFALEMDSFLDRPVIDQTDLKGKFDFTLKWTPDESHANELDAAPGIFTAVQEQLGLKFEPTKGSADVFVIDHVERSSGN